MIFDQYTEEEVEKQLIKIQDSSGNYRKFQQLKESEELVSIAKARQHAHAKTALKGLYFNEKDLRFATPDSVAEYRAERLKCDIIVDIGCSVGFQAFAFARHCKIVYAIEIDPRKIEYARRNARKLGIKNIEFLEGDALSDVVIIKIKEADIVFSDTERLPTEKQRSLRTISPDVVEVIEKYKHLTEDFCFEIPPSIGFVDVLGEKEYIDIERKLNRLNVYRGSLSKDEVSVISLLTGQRIAGKSDYTYTESQMEKYIGVVSTAVVKAGLVKQLAEQLGASIFDSSKIFLITSSEMKSSVFVEWFAAVDMAKDKDELKMKLKKRAAGKVVLRYSIPTENYWEEKKELESGLEAKDTVHVFRKEGYILAKAL